MTAYEDETMDRRDFLTTALLVGVGAFAGANVLMSLGRVQISVPGLGEVATGDHAVERHGLDAEAVRRFFAESGLVATEIFGQPPCKDRRYRIIVAMAENLWAIWVLERLRPQVFREITAFSTRNRDYIHALHDDCGNGGYWGHGLFA